MKWYFHNLLVAANQFICAIFGGWCDECISSYAYRLDNGKKLAGKILRPIVDSIALRIFGQDRHCMRSYEAERRRAQFPPELR